VGFVCWKHSRCCVPSGADAGCSMSGASCCHQRQIKWGGLTWDGDKLSSKPLLVLPQARWGTVLHCSCALKHPSTSRPDRQHHATTERGNTTVMTIPSRVLLFIQPESADQGG
jgi:hypothetical protein